MAEGGLPQEVVETTEREFGQKPEARRKGLNKQFNDIADKLGQRIDANTRFGFGLAERISPKNDENVVVGMGKAYGAAGIRGATALTGIELRLLKSLAELGAKATGGRRTPSAEAQKSK